MPRPLKDYTITVTQPEPTDPSIYSFEVGSSWSQTITSDELLQMMNEAASFAYVINIVASAMIKDGIDPMNFAAVKAYVEAPQRRWNF